MSEPRYHVLADPHHELPVVDLARVLAPLVGGSPQDLAMRLRRAQGWLARDVVGDRADAIADAIEEIGLPFHRIEATPHDVARPETERIKEFTITADAIEVELPFGVERFPLTDLYGVDLALLGEATDDAERDPHAANLRTMVEALPEPYSKQRLALLDHRASAEPLLHIFTGDPVRVLRVERGCRFSAYAKDDPGRPWLDYFLTLIDTFFEDLPSGRITPETVAFWRTKEITCILCPHAEELENRLGWIQALIRAEIWGRS